MESYSDLRLLSVKDLIAKYDSEADKVQWNVSLLLTEISRRDAEAQASEIHRWTSQMRNMTAVILILTLVNVGVVALQFWQSLAQCS